MLILCKLDTSQDPVAIDLPDDEDVSGLAQMIQMELSIPINEQVLSFNGLSIPISSQKLVAIGIHSGSTILLTRVSKTNKRMAPNDIPANISAEALVELMKTHPYLLDQLRQSEPNLADAIASNNIGSVRMILMSRHFAQHKRVYEHEREMQVCVIYLHICFCI